MIKETLQGPLGAKLHLGRSTATVEWGGKSCSYAYAVDACEIADGLELPGDVLDWLCSPSVEHSVDLVFSEGD